MSNDNLVPLTWHTEKRIIEDLVPYEANPRILSSKQLESLKKSLKRFNLVEIPAIDTDNRIIAGCVSHGRTGLLVELPVADQFGSCCDVWGCKKSAKDQHQTKDHRVSMKLHEI